MSDNAVPALQSKYDAVAPRWGDKMRLLGYFDAYLGFLSHLRRGSPDVSVIDIGAGSGAMAEAWVAINGAPRAMTLLDPSRGMLNRAATCLSARGVTPSLEARGLGEEIGGRFDVLLAAHVIEHFADPVAALADMRRLARPNARLWLVASKPHWCNALIWLQWRHRTFAPEPLTEMLAQAGFVAEVPYAFPSGPPSRTSFGVVARAV